MQHFSHDLAAAEIRGLVGDSPLVIEIGSHEGADTAKCLKAMSGITLHCFEPDQRPIARFKTLIGNDLRVTLHEMAVADVDGQHEFHASTGKVGHMDDWDYSGSLNRPTGHHDRSPEINFKEPVNVLTCRLDTWLRNADITRPIDFAWVDPQGSQRKVIAGGQETLARLRYLYIECHHPSPLYEGEPSREELIALLPGFEPLAVYAQDNILFENRTP